ncbi:MAG: hypothetical protein D6677_11330 [Calditrichaeota bacterium]|nr:MAG: hypothetical protein D6677_11330 [Calditrichota bacterium]
MKRQKLLWGLWALLFAVMPAVSQSAVITVTLEDRGLSQYQSVYLSDFDFLQVGATEELFALHINKTPGSVEEAVIRFDFKLDGKSLAFIKTKPFSLPEDAREWVFTNVDLSQGKTIDGVEIKIAESGVEDVGEQLQNEILATSQLPVGLYQLILTMNYTANGVQQETTDEQSFVIQNPTLLNLITPGTQLNSGIKYEVYTENPIFQWNGNSGQYQLVVFKKQQEASSADDILNSVPVFESGRLDGLVFQYPTANAYPLQVGETYVWLVKSFITTSSGENELLSELWEFTLVDPAKGQTVMSASKDQLINALNLLSEDDMRAVFSQLEGYDLNKIRFNGSIMSAQELLKKLSTYSSKGQYKLSDVTVR